MSHQRVQTVDIGLCTIGNQFFPVFVNIAYCSFTGKSQNDPAYCLGQPLAWDEWQPGVSPQPLVVGAKPLGFFIAYCNIF
jgi:hypothetical protein